MGLSLLPGVFYPMMSSKLVLSPIEGMPPESLVSIDDGSWLDFMISKVFPNLHDSMKVLVR